MLPTPLLKLSRQSAFERAVLRAVAGGAAGGLVRAAVLALGIPLPLWVPIMIAVCSAVARGDRTDRWLLRLGAVIGACLCAFLPIDGAEVCSGAIAGLLLLWSTRREQGATAVVAAQQLGPANYVLAALFGAGSCWLGTEVASALAAEGLALGVPVALVGAFAGATLGLFLGLSLATGHVVLRGNPVEARAAEVLPALRGDLQALARRALDAYRDCARVLVALPPRPEREELAHTLGDLTTEALTLAEQWAGIEDELAHRAGDEGPSMEKMDRAAAAATDPVARAHFTLAASTMREEAELSAGLERRRERMVAKLWSQAALLERARTSLVGARSGCIQIRAAELSGMARRLASLSESESLDGELAGEVATEAELSMLDATGAARAPAA